MIELTIDIDWEAAWNAMGRAARRTPGALTRLCESVAWFAAHHAQVLASAELTDATSYNASFDVETQQLMAILRNIHPAALFLEKGTRPHLIFPIGKSLRYEVGGRIVHSRWVRHPGTINYDFVQRGIDMASQNIETIARLLGRELIE